MQKYKVFINDRKFILVPEIKGKMLKREGALFYRYKGTEALKDLVNFFEANDNFKRVYIAHPDLTLLKEEFFGIFKYMEAGGGLVWDTNGHSLFIHRRGKWDLPKGKIEPGERPHEAAVREVSEETGLSQLHITQELCSTYHIFRDEKDNQLVLKRTFWFEMDYNGDETPVPEEAEGITQVEWFDRAQLGTVKNRSYGSIREVLKAAGLIY
jgi:8-oxo-dGTP pyrophosphatase MutT (NUDIX family)